MLPWTFPCTNTVINCPGATVTGSGYRYPMPTIVFADAFCPNPPGGNAAHNRRNVKHFITQDLAPELAGASIVYVRSEVVGRWLQPARGQARCRLPRGDGRGRAGQGASGTRI